MVKFNVGDRVKVIGMTSNKPGRIIHSPYFFPKGMYAVYLDAGSIGTYNENELELESSVPILPKGNAYSILGDIGDLWIDDILDDPKPKSNIKCECGASSVGVDKHAEYCPIYTIQDT